MRKKAAASKPAQTPFERFNAAMRVILKVPKSAVPPMPKGATPNKRRPAK